MRFGIITPALALVPLAASHGAVTSYTIGSTEYPGYNGFAPKAGDETIQRQWNDYSPVLSVTDAKMRCNGGTSAQLSAPIQAGENITAVYKQWTHQQGPVMVWLFKCAGDFASCDGSGKGWFKIDQMGMWGSVLDSNNWATAIVVKNLKWSSAIPKNLASGNYLIRHELLALHQANTPQFYPECAQLVVSGGGTAAPPAEFLFSIPGYAPQTDAGIAVSDTASSVGDPETDLDRSTSTRAKRGHTHCPRGRFGKALHNRGRPKETLFKSQITLSPT
jgi:hypothetical protein